MILKVLTGVWPELRSDSPLTPTGGSAARLRSVKLRPPASTPQWHWPLVLVALVTTAMVTLSLAERDSRFVLLGALLILGEVGAYRVYLARR